MKEFLFEYYSVLTTSVEILAAVTGLMLLKKYKYSTARYFIYFLVYVTFVELIGAYPRYFYQYEFLNNFKTKFAGTLFERNYWWYNIFWLIGSPLFYSFYFIQVIKKKYYKDLIKVCRALFLISAVLYIIFNPSKLFDNSIVFNSIIGAILILLSIIFFFIEVLQSERILTFYKSLNFFIAVIVFVWTLVITPLIFFNVYYSSADWNFIFLKWQIFLSMNMFMYVTFTIALIWCKPQNV